MLDQLLQQKLNGLYCLFLIKKIAKLSFSTFVRRPFEYRCKCSHKLIPSPLLFDAVKHSGRLYGGLHNSEQHKDRPLRKLETRLDLTRIALSD